MKSQKLYITDDNFVWLDVTEQMKHGHKKREELWLSHELFAVHEDESESTLESHNEIDEALKLGLRVCIEGGYLPKKYNCIIDYLTCNI